MEGFSDATPLTNGDLESELRSASSRFPPSPLPRNSRGFPPFLHANRKRAQDLHPAGGVAFHFSPPIRNTELVNVVPVLYRSKSDYICLYRFVKDWIKADPVV